MATDGTSQGAAAAGRLHDLAVSFAQRSHDAQAALVRAFEAAAAELSAEIGDLRVEDDDDERLTLTSAGRFRGQVFVRPTDPDASSAAGSWQAITSPDDVADFYDPVDLFDDVTDAIEEAFPETAGPDAELAGQGPDSDGQAEVPAGTPSSTVDPWFARQARTAGVAGASPEPGSPLESASLTILRDLHAAGVYSDEEFASKRAELEKPG